MKMMTTIREKARALHYVSLQDSLSVPPSTLLWLIEAFEKQGVNANVLQKPPPPLPSSSHHLLENNSQPASQELKHPYRYKYHPGRTVMPNTHLITAQELRQIMDVYPALDYIQSIYRNNM
mmetsp:Transcript_7132/g.11885  ORF Transcript_7132/g.11885 Transcript_7132/m.11885 type:complete len:121 (-) Transcript_7132:145-507(-)